MAKRPKKKRNYYAAHPNKGPVYVTYPRSIYKECTALDRCIAACKKVARSQARLAKTMDGFNKFLTEKLNAQ